MMLTGKAQIIIYSATLDLLWDRSAHRNTQIVITHRPYRYPIQPTHSSFTTQCKCIREKSSELYWLVVGG
jgi:hypothetical protein